MLGSFERQNSSLPDQAAPRIETPPSQPFSGAIETLFRALPSNASTTKVPCRAFLHMLEPGLGTGGGHSLGASSSGRNQDVHLPTRVQCRRGRHPRLAGRCRRCCRCHCCYRCGGGDLSAMTSSSDGRVSTASAVGKLSAMQATRTIVAQGANGRSMANVMMGLRVRAWMAVFASQSGSPGSGRQPSAPGVPMERDWHDARSGQPPTSQDDAHTKQPSGPRVVRYPRTNSNGSERSRNRSDRPRWCAARGVDHLRSPARTNLGWS